MERQHFVVLIDPVGRGRKTKHPVAGDESAAGDGGGGRGRANVGRPGKDGYVAARGTSVAARRREREARQRESGKAPRGGGMEGTGRESGDPHPADSYNFNHQLAGYTPASTGTTSYM